MHRCGHLQTASASWLVGSIPPATGHPCLLYRYRQVDYTSCWEGHLSSLHTQFSLSLHGHGVWMWALSGSCLRRMSGRESEGRTYQWIKSPQENQSACLTRASLGYPSINKIGTPNRRSDSKRLGYYLRMTLSAGSTWSDHIRRYGDRDPILCVQGTEWGSLTGRG